MIPLRNALIATLVVAVALFGLGTPEPAPLVADGEVFGYRAVQALNGGKYYPLNQGQIGTCVAVGHKGAADGSQANAKALGKAKVWKPVSAESIYGGARNEGRGRITGSMSDGSSGYAATKWLSGYGVVYMQPYPEYGIDLSVYDVRRAKEWGANGNGGRADGRDIPGKFDQEAAKHPIKTTAKVTSIEELDAALDNGYHVTICSNVGFNSPRDKDGFCRPSGSWSHCMHITARRDGGRKGYLVQNSWAAYIKGDDGDPKNPSANQYKDQPDGSFYVEPAVVLRILRQGDSYAIGSQDGFSRNVLPHWMTEADAAAPAGLTAGEDATDATQEERNARVQEIPKGSGKFFFREDDGRLLELKSDGHWYECNENGCRRVSSVATDYPTAA